MAAPIEQTFGAVAAGLGAALLGGAAARRLGQPAVLGELLAGVVVGTSVLGWFDPHDPFLHAAAEFGVALLLFEIGLETDLRELLRVGPAALLVALVGVALPLAGGYAVAAAFGLPTLACLVLAASLAATSVGITARVLSELGRLQTPEGRIILGAAVLDDVLGLALLTVVATMAQGQAFSAAAVAKVTALASAFLVGALLLGRWLGPAIVRGAQRLGKEEALTAACLASTFGLAWLAHLAGSAPIIGAFAAGVIFGGTGHEHEIHRRTAAVGRFLVPLFFVGVGASVELKALAQPAALGLGAALLAVAVATKFAAGYAPWWFKGNRAAVGVGMVPRGEVGLIFARTGLAAGALNAPQFAAAMLMVAGTTFLAPVLLRRIFGAPAA